MKIVMINGSLRTGGNTEIMAKAFAKGAEEKGHRVTWIPLAGKTIGGCMGCQYCFSHQGQCIQKDDMQDILAALDQAELVVFASPIYWFDITGSLKCVIDRMYARAKTGFHFSKTVLLLDSGSEGVYESAIAQYKAMTSYLHWEDEGILTISGMEEKGDMKTSDKLKDAYALGKSLTPASVPLL